MAGYGEVPLVTAADGAPQAPGGQGMQREADAAKKPQCTVTPLTAERVPDLYPTYCAAFGNKSPCGCIPGSETVESPTDFQKRLNKYGPEKWAVCGVATSDAGEVLGYLQLGFAGMTPQLDLPSFARHKYKFNEAHVEAIGVNAAARGKGVGTALMKWADDMAKARGCTIISLAVFNGNPAKRLYERMGYAELGEGCFDVFCTKITIWCIGGCPYPGGCCQGACVMEKPLVPTGTGAPAPPAGGAAPAYKPATA